jgi:phosphatidylglycerophosphate synthase
MKTTAQFKIQPHKVKEILKARKVKQILLFTVTGILILILQSLRLRQEDMLIGLISLIGYTVVISVVMILGYFYDLRKERRRLLSYILTIDEQSIIREEFNTPTIQILIIKSCQKEDVISIHPKTDNYDVLEDLLNQVKEVELSTAVSFMKKFELLFILLAITAMGFIFNSNVKLSLLIAGLVFVIFSIWSYNDIKSDKNVDMETKRYNNLSLVGLFLVVLLLLFAILRR